MNSTEDKVVSLNTLLSSLNDNMNEMMKKAGACGTVGRNQIPSGRSLTIGMPRGK